MEDKHFQSEKARILGKVDLSRKGSVDEPIRELIGFLNLQESFYTTSSCSGRVVIFSEVRFIHLLLDCLNEMLRSYFIRMASSGRRTAIGCLYHMMKLTYHNW